jgi:hypothetical protein
VGLLTGFALTGKNIKKLLAQRRFYETRETRFLGLSPEQNFFKIRKFIHIQSFPGRFPGCRFCQTTFFAFSLGFSAVNLIVGIIKVGVEGANIFLGNSPFSQTHVILRVVNF